jgi:UDP-glucuronate 4-epimerase
MRILVTGGAGFIGSHLCERLVATGHEVIAFDNFNDYYDPAIKRRNLVSLADNPAFTLVIGDLRDREAVQQTLRRYPSDGVVHLAAMAGVRPSIENPLLYSDVNVGGTMNLLEACRVTGVKNLLFASSSSVYGNNPKTPFSEDDRVDNPISPYAATKKAGELLCHTYHHLFGMSILCLRFFTVYGPRQRPDLAIHKFIRLIGDGRPVPVFGTGSTRRDYTYIDDILGGVLKALDYVQTGNRFDVFNLGESRTITLKEMIDTIESVMQKPAHREFHPLQPGDVEITYADITKSRNILGYDPRTGFREGVEREVEWLNSL